ncbi:MAG: NAD+ synthase [Proteobacteria bacterium]|nr:NAD+ synthase [Pseudomonadota bacterium]
MRWAIIQLNSKSADIRHNAEKIQKALHDCAQNKVDLLITPELPLIGYPPKDLLSLSDILNEEQNALKELQEASARLKVALLISHTEKSSKPNEKLFNSASLFDDGHRLGTIRKVRLPNYDIFEETRFFQSYNESQAPLEWRGLKLHISICEDAWNSPEFFNLNQTLVYPEKFNPFNNAENCDCLINLSASPFYMGKISRREKLFSSLAQKYKKPLFYADSVGGQDDLLFDGGSFAMDALGQFIAHAEHFQEDLLIFDWSPKATPALKASKKIEDIEFLFQALSLGLRDYVEKSGYSKVHLGLSGGMDSALVAALCKEALGAQNVLGLSLPSEITSSESKELASELAKNLDLSIREIPISESVKTLSKSLSLIEKGLSYENLQARVRGIILMAISNQENSLLISTGNKSELAMGYSTLYGDLCGALNPIGDLYKSDVYALARYLKDHKGIPIPEKIFTRPPSAELSPGQKDQDSLPSYEILDSLLFLYLEAGLSKNDKTLQEFIELNGIRKDIFSYIHRMEFKRYQSPPILKARFRSFGSGWRFPLAKKLH